MQLARRRVVVVALGLAALGRAPAAARAEAPSTVRDAYLQLRDQGCDVATIGSPIVARVLGHVPAAQRGAIFKAAELTDLFARDGTWYLPSSTAADLDAADRACVRRLAAQERRLRGRVKLRPAIEQAITRHTGAVLDMHRLVRADFTTFRQATQTRDGLRVWTIEFATAAAARVTVECRLPDADARARPTAWARLDCHVLAAG